MLGARLPDERREAARVVRDAQAEHPGEGEGEFLVTHVTRGPAAVAAGDEDGGAEEAEESGAVHGSSYCF